MARSGNEATMMPPVRRIDGENGWEEEEPEPRKKSLKIEEVEEDERKKTAFSNRRVYCTFRMALTRIIYNREYWAQPPDKMHARTLEIWGVKSFTDEVDGMSADAVEKRVAAAMSQPERPSLDALSKIIKEQSPEVHAQAARRLGDGSTKHQQVLYRITLSQEWRALQEKEIRSGKR